MDDGIQHDQKQAPRPIDAPAAELDQIHPVRWLSRAPVDFDATPLHGHGVAAARHAGGECAIVGGVSLGKGALLLRHVALLLLLLLLVPSGPAHEADKSAHAGADLGPLA